MKDFSDRIALVSGASRGLGYAVARGLGVAGAQVIALARTVGGLEDLDQAVRDDGGAPVTLVPLDVTDDPGLERMGAAIHDRWGRIDLWVHTAISTPPLAPVEHGDAKDMDRAFSINARATQRLIRVLDPLLRRSDAGRAVGFADPAAHSDALHGLYHASKAAQLALLSDWGAAAARTSPVRLLVATPPPMPTALRLRFHPGEDTSRLASTDVVADRLLAALRGGTTGSLVL